MSTEYDPKLQALFEQAEQGFDRDAFTREVMARIDRGRRGIVLLWSVLGILAIAIVALVAAPLTTAVSFASQLLPASLVEIETGLLQKLLSPVNSVAAAIAVGALALRRFYRWIFR
jgi:hypothetical protein